MSCNLITLVNGHKMASPVMSAEKYRTLRGSQQQLNNLQIIRAAQSDPSLEEEDRNRLRDEAKRRLVQFNYSLAPTDEEGSPFPLKGATEVGNSVGMDIDHLTAEQLQSTIQRVLDMREELGLLMLERSARGEGLHVVFRRHTGMSNEENLRWASQLLGVEYDKGAKDITRVFFATSNEEDDLLFLDEELFTDPLPSPYMGKQNVSPAEETVVIDETNCSPLKGNCGGAICEQSEGGQSGEESAYMGIPYALIIQTWWDMMYDGQTPVKSNRDVLTYELAVNLRHIAGFDRELMDKVIPCYDEFPHEQKMKCIDQALSARMTCLPIKLKNVLQAVRQRLMVTGAEENAKQIEALEDLVSQDDTYYYRRLPKMPQGVRESIHVAGPEMSQPVLATICPAIGALATGVRLDVHGTTRNLNLISYIVGDAASGKGIMDGIVDAWMAELKATDKAYLEQEKSWRARKRAAKNQQEQPEELHLPVRCITLNNTVANLADRLADTQGKHAFSFTPEADMVSQKWKSEIGDFSVMIRQSYDGSSYEREARSVDAANVHIDKLLWNVVMCGTPDALYRVVSNNTDGFQTRLAIAHTPDNTFTPLSDHVTEVTDAEREKIGQIAHLLPLLQGDICLKKLEKHGREWLEGVRKSAMMNYDTVYARQRFRICVTAQRMTCCIMLCSVLEKLIHKYGLEGAEQALQQDPNLWKEMIQKVQTPAMMTLFDVVAGSLMDNALYYFRDRIEAAFSSSNYRSNSTSERTRHGKNDTIYERLGMEFTYNQAFESSIAVKGAGITANSVQQMLKNWRNANLVEQMDNGHFRKLAA